MLNFWSLPNYFYSNTQVSEPKTKERKSPPCQENTKMSRTGVLKKWIETKKNEDGKFSITKCIKFNEPTVSTSKKRKKLSKTEKMKKCQQEKFKNFFGKPQSKTDSDKTIPIPGLESIPKPGDKIYSQKLVRKRKCSNEVVEKNAEFENSDNLKKWSTSQGPISSKYFSATDCRPNFLG